MTITLPILDTFVCAIFLFLSIVFLYQGLEICFMKRKEPLFPYKIMKLIANFLGNGEYFIKRTSYLDNSFYLNLQGVSALIGGVIGIISCVIFIINIISRIEVN